mmetsp:Transcript_22172/g.69156  ORF Transcript_22172/g.69156 Transcript_22172/m.69156 type:complete len:278 (+) Transcript_22172:2135-2968(+)
MPQHVTRGYPHESIGHAARGDDQGGYGTRGGGVTAGLLLQRAADEGHEEGEHVQRVHCHGGAQLVQHAQASGKRGWHASAQTTGGPHEHGDGEHVDGHERRGDEPDGPVEQPVPNPAEARAHRARQAVRRDEHSRGDGAEPHDHVVLAHVLRVEGEGVREPVDEVHGVHAEKELRREDGDLGHGREHVAHGPVHGVLDEEGQPKHKVTHAHPPQQRRWVLAQLGEGDVGGAHEGGGREREARSREVPGRDAFSRQELVPFPRADTARGGEEEGGQIQ